MNRDAVVPASSNPSGESMREKDHWIGEEAEDLLRAADALYSPLRREIGKLERFLGLVTWNVELENQGLEGCLVTDGTVGGIVVNMAIRYVPRRTFTYAHEIGHYILHRNLAENYFRDGKKNLNNFESGIEAEANLFAAALLIPPSVLSKHCRPDVAPRLAQVNSLMSSCEVSVLAAMCRIVRTTEYPCVLAVFKSGLLEWSLGSDAFEGKMLSKGTRVPLGSTAELYSKGTENRQNKYHNPGTPAEWWLTEGDYTTADESTVCFNRHYIYCLLTFWG